MAAVAPLYTADVYESLVEAGVLGPDDHVELLLGVIVEVSPQGPRHSDVVRFSEDALRGAVGGRAEVRSQMPFRASPY